MGGSEPPPTPPPHPPPPSQPPRGSPAPAPSGWPEPPPTSPPRSNRRRWIVAGLVLLLLLGGCGTLVTVGAMRAFQGFTAPIDVANDYLDAARAGTDLTPYACRPDEPPRPEVVTSREQNLNSVEIDGRSFAEVEGSLTLEERLPARVTVFLSRRDDWCVSAVEIGQP